jgi:hypothetical protein
MQIGVKNIKNLLVTSIIINNYDVKKKKLQRGKNKKKEKKPSMVHKNNMPFYLFIGQYKFTQIITQISSKKKWQISFYFLPLINIIIKKPGKIV